MATNIMAAVDYKEAVAVVVKEYFDSLDHNEVARSLRELQKPLYHYYFVKCVVKTAMDRGDKEKEMAAQLLSALLCDDVLEPGQVSKGFVQLLETAQDQKLDVPETPQILALFLVRASVDDILPHAFLKVCAGSLPDDVARSIVKEAISHLTRPDVADWILHVWGSTKGRTVEEAKAFISDLVAAYIAGGTSEDVRAGLHQLALPFFHHEFVKHSLVLAATSPPEAAKLMQLLKDLTDSRDLSSSQVTKGLTRVEETLYDKYDADEADAKYQELLKHARTHKLLLEPAEEEQEEEAVPESPSYCPPHTEAEIALFKAESERIVREYFASASLADAATSVTDLLERASGREGEGDRTQLLRHLVKRAVTVALDHTVREKEFAAQLLSALYPQVLTSAHIAEGFMDLCAAADDLALDIVDAHHEVALFLARAVVDDVLAPADLWALKRALKGTAKVVTDTAEVLLGARHAAERILRVWGGAEVGTVGWAKAAFKVMLAEYVASEDIVEARRCLREVNMPHFHHEVVKQALCLAVESDDAVDPVFSLLKAFAGSMEISSSELAKGFARMNEAVDDLSLDVPGAPAKYVAIKTRAQAEQLLA
uniref:MI domain-containing protein n=1 Tax=Pyramimonas obovata TaxID=1411642 RepID=A0A7S0RHG6_9CHLO|mmetsp:Transcript_34263/g.74943  ORF Transcript_34263/g.74943 Transcript_34263/m.74943 type:complete len:598 (+) Transcript_34263:337-2130(+)